MRHRARIRYLLLTVTCSAASITRVTPASASARLVAAAADVMAAEFTDSSAWQRVFEPLSDERFAGSEVAILAMDNDAPRGVDVRSWRGIETTFSVGIIVTLKFEYDLPDIPALRRRTQRRAFLIGHQIP